MVAAAAVVPVAAQLTSPFAAILAAALGGTVPAPHVLVATLLGVVAGLGVPVFVYRLAVPAGQPSRPDCHHCRLPFRRGPVGWLPRRPRPVGRLPRRPGPVGRLPRRPGPVGRLPLDRGPVGWLRSGAGPARRLSVSRCVGCGTRLGPSAVTTALVGALTFGLLAATLGTDPALPAFLLVAGVSLVLGAVDVRSLRLPDRLVGLAGALATGGLVVAAIRAGEPARLTAVLAGGLVCGGGHLLLALLPGSRLGFGDVKLAAVLGLLLGWLGWQATLLGMAVPHLVNGLVVLGLLAAGRVGRRTVLPLGPALLVGALIAVLARPR